MAAECRQRPPNVLFNRLMISSRDNNADEIAIPNYQVACCCHAGIDTVDEAETNVVLHTQMSLQGRPRRRRLHCSSPPAIKDDDDEEEEGDEEGKYMQQGLLMMTKRHDCPAVSTQLMFKASKETRMLLETAASRGSKPQAAITARDGAEALPPPSSTTYPTAGTSGPLSIDLTQAQLTDDVTVCSSWGDPAAAEAAEAAEATEAAE
ncbi:hypothetical protein VaNZ11_015469, partial [Volvox africanus]